MKKHSIPFTLGLLLVFCWSGPSFGAAVKGMNLQEIYAKAGTVFAGVCTKAEPAQGHTVYTFQAERILKGTESTEMSIRISRMALDYARAPKFSPGETVVLFLYPESAQGFTSPVGLGQGKFSVIYTDSGERQVVNAIGNRRLFKGMRPEVFKGASVATEHIRKAVAQPESGIAYDVFLAMVGELGR